AASPLEPRRSERLPDRDRALQLLVPRPVAAARRARRDAAAVGAAGRRRGRPRRLPAHDHPAARAVPAARLPRPRERRLARKPGHRAATAADPGPAAPVRPARRGARVRRPRPVPGDPAHGGHDPRPEQAPRLMGTLLDVLFFVPLAGVAAALLRRRHLSETATVLSGCAVFGLALAAASAVEHGGTLTSADRWLHLDALGAVFLLATGFLYAACAVFSIGYLRADERRRDYLPFAGRYFTYLNLFGWTMVAVPLMNDFATLWIAVELTTIVSVLLVALDRTDAALEAAWKYVLIASFGLGMALLA